jgi:hypothetical protein
MCGRTDGRAVQKCNFREDPVSGASAKRRYSSMGAAETHLHRPSSLQSGEQQPRLNIDWNGRPNIRSEDNSTNETAGHTCGDYASGLRLNCNRCRKSNGGGCQDGRVRDPRRAPQAFLGAQRLHHTKKADRSRKGAAIGHAATTETP